MMNAAFMPFLLYLAVTAAVAGVAKDMGESHRCQVLLHHKDIHLCQTLSLGLGKQDCQVDRAPGRATDEFAVVQSSICRSVQVFLDKKNCDPIGDSREAYTLCMGIKTYVNQGHCDSGLLRKKGILQTCMGVEAAVKAQQCADLPGSLAQITCLALRQNWRAKELETFLQQFSDMSSDQKSCPVSLASSVVLERNQFELMGHLFHDAFNLTGVDEDEEGEGTGPVHQNDQKARQYGQVKEESDLPALSLDKKIEKNFARFEMAREVLMTYVEGQDAPEGKNFKSMSRLEWERLLAPTSPNLAIGEKDLGALRKRHKLMEAMAKENAEDLSIFNLNHLRGNPERIRKFCSLLPKGGLLHVHPLGTIDQETVQEILNDLNPVIDGDKIGQLINDKRVKLPKSSLDFLKNLAKNRVTHYLGLSESEKSQFHELFHMSMPHDHHGRDPDDERGSFENFESVFKMGDIFLYGKELERGEEIQKRIYLSFLKKAKQQKVSYVEFTEEITPTQDNFEKLKDLTEELERETKVKVRWNFAFYRQDPKSDSRQKAQDLLKLLGSQDFPYIQGIDLYGKEDTYSAFKAGQELYLPLMLARRKGKIGKISSTMHAGEFDFRPQNTRDALILGVDRLGHAVQMQSDPLILEYARRKEIPVETSLLSNIHLGAVKKVEKHPYLTFFRLGLKVGLSTDDEGIFGSSINEECFTAIDKTDITYYELKEMAFNSLRTSFLPENEKRALLKELSVHYQQFEADLSVHFPSAKKSELGK